MLVKTATSGETEFNAASNGKANAGLALGIVGTSLGALASGILGANGTGLFNNNVNGTCVLSEKEYYTSTIDHMKDFFAYAQGVSDRICALEQRVAIDETSIAKNFEIENMRSIYENRLIQKQFDCVDTRFDTTNTLTDYKIEAATCDFVKANKFLAPSQLADPYTGSTILLGSRQVFPTYTTYGCNNWGWNNWSGDCGCNCGF